MAVFLAAAASCFADVLNEAEFGFVGVEFVLDAFDL
jgi:hypothetical protein